MYGARIVLLFLFPCLVLPQSSTTEYWAGTRSTMGKSQSIVVHVERSKGLEKATVDLPDFGALSIPAARFAVESGRVHFELIGDTEQAIFDGKIDGNSIHGAWNEGKRAGEFELHRGAEAPVRLREEEVVFEQGNVRLAGTLLFPHGAIALLQ